jgi:hypothetical protein
MVAITLPWVLAVNVATDGAFLREAIGRHVLDRSMSSFEGHGFFFGFYLLTAVVVAFPWISMLIEALGGRGRRLFEVGELKYLVAWLVGPLVLLELVQTKLVHYWMPSYPAGVLLVVGWAVAARARGWQAGVPTRVVAAVGALLLAVIPAGFAVYLGLTSLLGVGLTLLVVLIPAIVGGVLIMKRRPVRGLVILSMVSAAFLIFLATVFLPRFGFELLAPRAAGRAVELQLADERIVVYKDRDADLFFYLPVDVVTCWGADCMEEELRSGGRLLVIARERDFELLVEEWPDVTLRVIDRVDGIDIGHVRPDTLVLFRPVDPAQNEDRVAGILTPVGDAG